MFPEPLSVEEQEREYNWLGAFESYRKALGLVPEQDYSRMGEIYERLGYASYRAAMQAESVNEFKTRCTQAIENCKKAKELYGRLGESGKKPRMLRCDAMIAYVGYWLASEVPEKKRLIDECWRLTKEALKTFEEAGDPLEYGKTYDKLSSAPRHRYALEWNLEAGEKIIMDAIKYGEQTITLLSGVRDSNELARVYAKTAIYVCWFGWYFIPDMDEKERQHEKGLAYWQKAKGLSEEAALLLLLSISSGSGDEMVWSCDELLFTYEKALGCAHKTKDKYLIGNALDMLAYASFWKAFGTEDPDKRAEILQSALQYAEDAKHLFSPISFISSRGDAFWTGVPYAEYYWELAYWETDLRKRHDLLEKAITDGTNAIKLAESTGYPNIMIYAHHILSKSLGSLAQIETSSEEKRRLLEKAMEHRKESVRITEQVQPFTYWNLGVMWNYLADLRAELSNVSEDSKRRETMLEEAISDKKRSLQLCMKENSYWEKRGELSYFAVLGKYQYSYGEFLNHLCILTNNNEHQRKAIKAFEEAAGSFQKLNLVSRMAECYWKAAKGYDALGEHLKAAENFNIVSNNYSSAAEKIPQLKNFYQDYAIYMQAWSEIEKARDHHVRQEYSSAEENYEKAAQMHQSLRRWSYLAPNYAAWGQVENAEDLSRKEKSEGAIQSFKKAAELFNETKKALQTELSEIGNLDEKQMATNLIKATDLRREYCIGRIALEEAKILDKKGEHYSSSEKYGSATETFEKITRASESEQDRKELKLIATLSRAWQKMTRAEAEASPALYMEASQLFEEAKELSPHEKGKMLALGHSRFCRALEAGTKFVDTRDLTMHATAAQYLESAADYYVKAGFQHASEYAKATGLLFDAYVYIDNAKKESDPEKKAKLYMMTERVLEKSAGCYMKAEHPEKREQVLRLLEKVKEERELALSLTEVLHTPLIVSTTAFPAPTPTHEKAVGLEQFEHANVQAHLTVSEEVTVGEELEVQLELINVGKNFGLLVRLDNLVPPGFKVTTLPSQYSIENGSINMKGKRLEPLKVESIKLCLQATEAGVINLSPQVIYVDDIGQFRICKLEPVGITVHPKLTFEFKTKAAQSVFDFLINSFAEDYMKQRISLEKSGWRTLMEIVKHGKVSKSSLYGARGRRGQAIFELERRGLVETRVFPGERGRGGRILKMRISYEKETIKRHIDQRIMKIKEK